MSGGLKERLTITRCTVENGTARPNGDKMEAMLNPASLSRSHSISYSGDGRSGRRCSKVVQGQTAAEPRFSAIDAEKLSFELIFDGTGAVPGRLVDVGQEIERLKSIVYRYNGDAHEPNVVRLTWGGSRASRGG